MKTIFLPDGGVEDIYADVSPINIYQLIFDKYLGSDLPFLEDTSYCSIYDEPISLEVIPKRSGSCGERFYYTSLIS